jgi:hypothetical protein
MEGEIMGRRSCPTTGKVRFFDHKDAVRALHFIKGEAGYGSGKRKERRSYECPFCKGWHLTSQPDKAGLIDPAQVVSPSALLTGDCPQQASALRHASDRDGDAPLRKAG